MASMLLRYLSVSLLLNAVHSQYQQNGARYRSVDSVMPSVQIIDTSPQSGKLIKQGQTETLSCTTNVNWFFCVWKSPGGGKQCAIQDTTTQNVCAGDQRIVLKGRQNKCEIELRNARPEDRGKWTCHLTETDQFGTDKATIEVEIAVPATVRFDPGYGEAGVLRLTEGDKTEIRCAATGGFPAPQLSWSEPPEALIDISQEPDIVTLSNGHTMDVFHSIRYTASLTDNNTVFTCVATQLDLNGKDVLYESSASLVVRVDKLILPPSDHALTQKITLISGVVVGVILLILLIVILALIACKRRRKRSRPPSSQATDDTSPETHTSVVKPIWTTDRGMVTSPAHHLMTTSAKPYKDVEDGAPLNSTSHYQRSRHHHNNLHNTSSNSIITPHSRPLISQNVSQGTVSTKSTISQCSWEEDRSVGGEIEDVATVQRLAPPGSIKTPSLHETHFDSDLDLPRTVLHHPDPYALYANPQHQQLHQSGLPQHIPYRSQLRAPPALHQRPSSSLASNDFWPPHGQQSPLYAGLTGSLGPGGRPTSALGGPGSYDTLGSGRKMPPPNGQLTTSVKSVFDCDLGCFVNEDGEHVHPASSTAATSAATTTTTTAAASASLPTAAESEALMRSSLEPREV